MILSRCAARFLALCLLIQPAHAFPLLERRSDGAVGRYVWGLSDGEGAGGLLAWGTSGGALYPLYDAGGNVLAWTDSQGQVVGSLGYTAFGQMLYREIASPPASPSTQGVSLSALSLQDSSIPTPPALGHATKAFSTAAAGLTHLAEEAYRADLGRLGTADPSGQRNGSNLYIYGENEPLSTPPPGSWVPPHADPPSSRPVPARVVPPGNISKHPTEAEAVPSVQPAQQPPPRENPNVSKASPGKGGSGRGRKGETQATKRGREVHKRYNPGPDYRKEFRLPSGRRPDAVNLRGRVVRELKPNNPRAIRRGLKQLEAYVEELQRLFGGTWTSGVDTYEP